MNKDFLDKIENTNNELERLRQRIKKIENKEYTVIKDSVQGSSTSYPYIKHNCVIERCWNTKKCRTKKKIQKDDKRQNI